MNPNYSDMDQGDRLHPTNEAEDEDGDTLLNFSTPISTFFTRKSTVHVSMSPSNRNSSTDTFETMEVDDDHTGQEHSLSEPPSLSVHTHVPNMNDVLVPQDSPDKELPSDLIPEPPDSSSEFKPFPADNNLRRPILVGSPFSDCSAEFRVSIHQLLPVLHSQPTDEVQAYLHGKPEASTMDCSPPPSPPLQPHLMDTSDEPEPIIDCKQSAVKKPKGRQRKKKLHPTTTNRLQDDVEYIVGQPTDADVPFGRGHFVNGHVGHHKYLDAIKARQSRYNQANKDKQAKQAIVREMIGNVVTRGGRFVKKDGTGWYVVPSTDQRVYDKVRQSLKDKHTKDDRDAKRKKYSKNKKRKRKNSLN